MCRFRFVPELLVHIWTFISMHSLYRQLVKPVNQILFRQNCLSSSTVMISFSALFFIFDGLPKAEVKKEKKRELHELPNIEMEKIRDYKTHLSPQVTILLGLINIFFKPETWDLRSPAGGGSCRYIGWRHRTDKKFHIKFKLTDPKRRKNISIG